MFNAMTPAQLTAVLSGTLRESADWARPLDGFQRGQLKSAGSIGRHLAAELAGGPAVAARFRADLRALLCEPRPAPATTRPAAGTSPAGAVSAAVDTVVATAADTVLGAAAEAVVAAIDGDPSGDVAALGAPIGDLLAACRAAGPDGAALAADVRSLLRDLVDAEIDLLSRPTETRPAAPPASPTGGTR
ncbi:hypothetical protein [Pseudonocardia sp. D17]|uniref:hypothetical protein n=1 Tax=Pseudonocardia sp. D17 TaxID=882661 RepID=UPI002B390B03|nr:hypothetical protein PSD17_04850 [Pseudonocardia sp. D17]